MAHDAAREAGDVETEILGVASWSDQLLSKAWLDRMFGILVRLD